MPIELLEGGKGHSFRQDGILDPPPLPSRHTPSHAEGAGAKNRKLEKVVKTHHGGSMSSIHDIGMPKTTLGAP